MTNSLYCTFLLYNIKCKICMSFNNQINCHTNACYVQWRTKRNIYFWVRFFQQGGELQYFKANFRKKNSELFLYKKWLKWLKQPKIAKNQRYPISMKFDIQNKRKKRTLPFKLVRKTDLCIKTDPKSISPTLDQLESVCRTSLNGKALLFFSFILFLFH